MTTFDLEDADGIRLAPIPKAPAPRSRPSPIAGRMGRSTSPRPATAATPKGLEPSRDISRCRESTQEDGASTGPGAIRARPDLATVAGPATIGPDAGNSRPGAKERA